MPDVRAACQYRTCQPSIVLSEWPCFCWKSLNSNQNIFWISPIVLPLFSLLLLGQGGSCSLIMTRLMASRWVPISCAKTSAHTAGMTLRAQPILEHDYSITGWALSVMPAVQADVVEQLIGTHRDAITLVIIKLYEPPCPNRSNEIKGKIIGDIKHMFWLEFKDFQQKTGPFGKKDRWLISTALKGSSHVWYELFSLPYTGVLGFVACRVYS